MKRRAFTARGFTLIEAIIAIVVLSIAMPAMLWALRESTAERVDPVMVTRARWLAAERLETLTATGIPRREAMALSSRATIPTRP